MSFGSFILVHKKNYTSMQIFDNRETTRYTRRHSEEYHRPRSFHYTEDLPGTRVEYRESIYLPHERQQIQRGEYPQTGYRSGVQPNSNTMRDNRGKGPRNYRRSDVRIEEDIHEQLGSDPVIDAREIIVEVSNGEVILTGSVNNRWDKRKAADLIEAVAGVQNVENRLRIKGGGVSQYRTEDPEFRGNAQTQLSSFEHAIRVK
jgi:osmotically-inducible protein OsmY